MGNEAEFHFGKRRSREGLEFVSGRKRPAIRHRPAHPHPQAHTPHISEQSQPQVTEVPPYTPEIMMQALAAQQVDPLAHIYQEPMLVPIITQEEVFDDTVQPPEKLSLDPHEQTDIVLHEDAQTRPSAFRRVMSVFIALIAISLLTLSVLFLMNNKPNISSDIRDKAGYTLYDIAPNNSFKLDKKSVELTKEGNLVYFVDNAKTKAHFVISQQKIPDVVKNESDYKQFLADFDKYAEFNSKIGKAYFTHPANIGSDISVVVKTSTTLMFIRGPGTTTDQDWTTLLSYLLVVK